MLTQAQLATLRAAVDRIIPPDDDPGGWEGGVGSYLARQFERDLRPLLEVYRAGLDALDAEALAQFEQPFAEMDTEAQDALLLRLEQGEVRSEWPVDAMAFFNTLVEHALEGYYGDPGNGGNPGASSWHMIGFTLSE